jgi:hypothetical protein
MKTVMSFLRIRPILDKNGRLFGKYDIFVPLFFLIVLVLGFFITRILLQKDTYVTAELFASGGEWWWNNPAPPHWLTDPIQKGSIEYDPQGNTLVEVVDTQKFEAADRKMLWMKVRLRVTPMKGSRQYRFRREPLLVGSLIYVAPNNIRIASNVMWIEGTGEERRWEEKVITIEEYNVFPWLADAVGVGNTMKSDDGTIMAEVIEKNVRLAQSAVVEWDRPNEYKVGAANRLNVIPNIDRRDITLKLRVRTSVLKNQFFFSYFQPLKVGFYIWIPLEGVNISGNIISIE